MSLHAVCAEFNLFLGCIFEEKGVDDGLQFSRLHLVEFQLNLVMPIHYLEQRNVGSARNVRFGS